MGCCTSLKSDIFLNKEYIVNLGPKDIEDFIFSTPDTSKNKEKSCRKSSSKTAETNAESPKKAKKRKKSENFHNQRTKNIANNLRLIAISEVKNMRKFFDLK